MKNKKALELRKSRKAQLKTMETIAILIVFFMLVMFGLIMYSYFKRTGVQRDIERLNILHAINVYTAVYNMPEFQASLSGVETGSALDILKLNSTSLERWDGSIKYPKGGLMSKRDINQSYRDIFGFSTIEVKVIYTLGDNTHPYYDSHWVIYRNEKIDSGSKPYLFPVALYNQLTNEYYLGYMNITVYDG